jgi:hypothetical protein
MNLVGALIELVANVAVEASITATLEAITGRREQPEVGKPTECDRSYLSDLDPQARAEIESWSPRSVASGEWSDRWHYSGKAR